MGRRANAAFLVALAMGTPWVSAQEKPKSEDVAMEARQTETTPLKISVTFTEFEGDKKVKSLPYTTIVIADGKRAFVGSINLSPGSFDSRRELAIETKSKRVLKRLVQVSRRDWKHSQTIDLSDAGILADLEKHGSKDANLLALGR